jgi:uncharacterized membrane-anchored protein
MSASTSCLIRRSAWRWLAALALTLCALVAPSGPLRAQTGPMTQEQREAEEKAAWQAAVKAGIPGPNDVPLSDQGSFSVPLGFFFIPKAEGTRLMRAWGNVVSGETFLGLVASPRNEDQWIADISFIKEGYVKDDEAKNWDPDDLLSRLKDGTEAANEDRRERGYPEVELVGWVERPSYDGTTHRLVWSASSKLKGAGADRPQTVNYNTYLLGREGYFALDFIDAADRIEGDKATARDLLAHLSFAPGKRYEDFSTAAGDKVAAYGIAALVGGIAAKKLGMLALAGAFIVKFAKIIALGAVGLFAGVARLFKRRPSGPSNAGIERRSPPS